MTRRRLTRSHCTHQGHAERVLANEHLVCVLTNGWQTSLVSTHQSLPDGRRRSASARTSRHGTVAAHPRRRPIDRRSTFANHSSESGGRALLGMLSQIASMRRSGSGTDSRAAATSNVSIFGMQSSSASIVPARTIGIPRRNYCRSMETLLWSDIRPMHSSIPIGVASPQKCK
jgi:hypothetical protein